MRKRTFVLCLTLMLVFVLVPLGQAVAQEYYIKKENNSVFSRLFGWGKKKDAAQEQAKKQKAKRKSAKSTLPHREIKIPLYEEDENFDFEELDAAHIQEEIFGECSDEDKKALPVINKMFSDFDDEIAAFQEEGKVPEGYSLPKGNNIEDYEEEDFDDAKPAGLHAFMMEPENSEQVVGVMMRCNSFKKALEDRQKRRDARAERAKKR